MPHLPFETIVGLSAGIALILWGIFGYLKEIRIRRSGMRAMGTVIAKRTIPKQCELTIQFKTAANKSIKAKYRPLFSANNWQYSISDPVEIAYLPDKPDQILIPEDKLTLVTCSLLGIMGLLWTTWVVWIEFIR